MNAKQKEQIEAQNTLRAMINPGDTVYTVLRHVSTSGMTRIIGMFAMIDNQPREITYQVAKATGDTITNKSHYGIKATGCGMDMGFHLVYNLGRVLWPEGFECIGHEHCWPARCPSNDHSNGDFDFTPHNHKDGGYALRHKWL